MRQSLLLCGVRQILNVFTEIIKINQCSFIGAVRTIYDVA